ncbi:MAG: MlaD family protein [Endomicrobium sp.]|jgi:phospholipid/cholesterol/gamma-HCH transport system substrate-binding protein|nr:MlaD family protein [Endomicrobium sp.]
MKNQLKLGIFVVAGFIAIAVSIIAVGSLSLKKTYGVYVLFPNASGLLHKAKVKIAGVDIGLVSGVNLQDGKAKLHLRINEDVTLYKNATASIVSMGIIGTKYIEVISGDSGFEKIKDGDTITSTAGTSMEDTLNALADKISKAFEGTGKDGDMFANLAEAIYDLKLVMKNISEQNGKIASAIGNIDKFSGDIAQITDRNKDYINDSVASLRDMSVKLDMIVSKIYEGNGVLSALINDPQIGGDLKETMANAKETMVSAKETVKSLQDTVGRADKLQFMWDYTGRYNIKDAKFRNDLGITIMPSEHKFYRVGLSNVANSADIKEQSERDTINRLDALIGFRSKNAEVYAGVMRSKAGVGAGYSFFEPIYAPYRTLQAFVNVYDMGRKERGGPEIDAGARVGITKWLYAGVMVEDALYKTAVTPFIKLEINDRDLASLLGIISIAAVASR